MKHVVWCIDYASIWQSVHDLMMAAQRHIYLALYQLDWDQNVKPGVTFIQLLKYVCGRGVQVSILLSDQFLSVCPPPTWLPRTCEIKVVVKPGSSIIAESPLWKTVTPLLAPFVHLPAVSQMTQIQPYYFHQQYMIVDDELAIVGSLDLNKYVKENPGHREVALGDMGQHALACIVTPNASFCQFAVENFAKHGEAAPSEVKTELPFGDLQQPPSFVGSFPAQFNELDLIYTMIRDVRHVLYIETRYFISHRETRNQIAKHLVDRLVRAYTEKEDLKIVVFVNKQYFTSTMDSYLSSQLALTALYISSLLEEHKIDPTQMVDYFFIGSLTRNIPTAIVTTCILQDTTRCLLTSSPLWDRSLTHQCDELGIVIDDPTANSHLRTTLWQEHLEISDAKELLKACYMSSPSTKVERYRAPTPTITHAIQKTRKVLSYVLGDIAI